MSWTLPARSENISSHTGKIGWASERIRRPYRLFSPNGLNSSVAMYPMCRTSVPAGNSCSGTSISGTLPATVRYLYVGSLRLDAVLGVPVRLDESECDRAASDLARRDER